MDTFSDITPSYEAFPLYVAKFRTMMSIGTSVVLSCAFDGSELYSIDQLYWNEKVVIATILQYKQETNTIRVNLWQSPLNHDCNQQLRTFSVGHAAGLTELVQTFAVIELNAASILDVAFLFQEKEIKSGKSICQGIRNCFVVRYHYNNGVYSDMVSFYTFPSNHPCHLYFNTCYLYRIWSCISMIQDIIWVSLNKATEKQSKFGESTRFHIDQEMIDYLVLQSISVVPVQPVKSPVRIRATTMKGLRRVAFWVHRDAFMLRYDTEKQLSTLRSIIGNATALGMQKRRPKLASPDKIIFNDPFHLIFGSSKAEASMKIRTHRPGVDIIYNQQQCIVSVRYEKFIYNDAFIQNQQYNNTISKNLFIRDMMSGITMREDNIISQENEFEENSIQLNSYIQRENDAVLKVTRFNNSHDKVILTYVYPLEKRGIEVIEGNFEKLKLEINRYVFDNRD
jgi:hypothetical protein